MSRVCWLIAVLAATPANPVQSKQAPVYAVVVNAANPFKCSEASARALITRLYLKQFPSWPNGRRARPYGRGRGSAEQIAFQKNVLKKSKASLIRHWLTMKSLKGAAPPRQVSSDRMVAKFVSKDLGAFGVLPVARANQPGIRILFRFR